ncbi:MAG TPA: RagB/SusD family nutrient uptake outer membrane protein, partial [Prolixibacteraceae bacterium]|nr:RagB/SusD family nutrient uptake outer membrane protein [Prolixibacteraceae bacterium]
RTIELCFEGHYYQDIRRWMDAPQTMAGPLYGMDVEKLPSGYDKTQYPTGYKYTRILLPADRQSRWKDEMYYFPFDNDDMYKMKNFVPNPVW